ncbi:hypothetical protein [Ancylobacter oerskovii]|uniref:DUF4258 domain-containing protein n=1 Tax=Ancylobacter oerskovii TaxID=459519 RepID=A0ABW4YVN5_9HYPH|nr:hypothetical protein [Ancylobacter oerskovii]MBS7544321.1 hypothetical protein [Ancylobacter oerskovii]
MAEYRMYELCNQGRIRSASEFEATDDAVILEHARQLHRGNPLEIWHGVRIVAALDPSGRSVDPGFFALGRKHHHHP